MKSCSRLALILLTVSAGAMAQESRPSLGGVSSARIANYNAPSVLYEGREQVRAIVEDLNQLRRKAWTRGEAKLACYSTIILMRGKQKVGEFRVRSDGVVDRGVEKNQATYSITPGPEDLPRLHKMLADIAPAKDCS